MKLLQRLRNNLTHASSTGRRPRLTRQLTLETLESRLTPTTNTFVVPVTIPADNVTTFHSLALAMTPAAANGLVVTVEPGAATDLIQPVTVSRSGITIQGDPNVPAAILPSYQLFVFANNVTLKNLNLASVALGQSTGSNSLIFKNTVSNCLVGSLSDFGTNSVFVQNTFSAGVKIIGTNQNTQADVIQNNLFASTTGTLLEIDFGFGTQVLNNRFLGDSSVAIKLANCNGFPPGPTTVAGNIIQLNGGPPGSSTGIEVEQVGVGLLSLVSISENTISTQGTGIHMDMTVGGNFTADVENNDLHGNVIGVSISGDGSTGIGSAASISLDGNNDFRSFKAPASATSAAIVLQNAPTTTVHAQHNVFSATPTTVVFAASGTIDVANSLSGSAAFVQTLYARVLGRSPATLELSFWVKAVGLQGQAAVANGILRSSEGLGPIVDKLYLSFLGRQSDASGRAGWIGFLQNGGTQEQVETAFLTSPEYLSHIDTDFVQSLYLNIFGRTGGASELAFWNNQIKTLGLVGIANRFVQSTENRQNTITADFQTFLHRKPSSTELPQLSSSSSDFISVEATILSGKEFFNGVPS